MNNLYCIPFTVSHDKVDYSAFTPKVIKNGIFCNKGKRTQKFKNHDIGNEVLSKHLLQTMLNVSYLKKVRVYLSNLVK